MMIYIVEQGSLTLPSELAAWSGNGQVIKQGENMAAATKITYPQLSGNALVKAFIDRK